MTAVTLRDALAAALDKHTYAGPNGTGEEEAHAILSDPAFREALVEAIVVPLLDFDIIDYRTDPHGVPMVAINAADAIVEGMLR